MMDVVTYFKLMERVILGTGYIPLRYMPDPNEKFYCNLKYSIQCPFCNVYFRVSKKQIFKSDYIVECPCCFKELDNYETPTKERPYYKTHLINILPGKVVFYLVRDGISLLCDLCNTTEKELLTISGFGQVRLQIVKDTLKDLGLTLKNVNPYNKGVYYEKDDD